jgi:hypothetical protein
MTGIAGLFDEIEVRGICFCKIFLLTCKVVQTREINGLVGLKRVK